MLNDAQQAAVNAVGHCLITAAPGSGKTRVLQERVAVLLARHRDARVCAVAFTKASAKELDERIRHQSPNAGDRVMCGTFHSICKRMLEGAGVRFKLLNEGDADALMRRAFSEVVEGDDHLAFDDAQAFINHTKCSVDPILPSPYQDTRVAVYERYQMLLQRQGAFDMADLLVECVRGLKSGKVPCLPITHLLIDEFQDADDVQLSWALVHAQYGVEVTVVGDDDQSIYGWRGGKGFPGMRSFQEATQARHIPLTMSYRCPREIMTPSARLISINRDRVPKQLDTACRTQGFVFVRRYASAVDEIDALSRAIIMSGDFGQWGVLARTNSQLDAVERGLEAANIEYRRLGGKSFWEQLAPAAFLSVCQSLANNDMVGITSLMVRGGVAPEHIAAVETEVRSHIPGSLERFAQGGPRRGGIPEVETLRGFVGQWRDMLHMKNDEGALSAVASYLSKQNHNVDTTFGPDRRAKDAKLLKHCVEALSRTSATSDGRVMQKHSTSLKTRLMRATQKKEADEDDKEKVKLMTLHSSKGLEFPKVWIVGCVEGVIPSGDSPLEEERRLFYVGMTRSKEDLTLSHVIDERTPVSRFIGEAGLV
jgi:DNA helicase-2/ATP-dependent DNA helicase PcrA